MPDKTRCDCILTIMKYSIYNYELAIFDIAMETVLHDVVVIFNLVPSPGCRSKLDYIARGKQL